MPYYGAPYTDSNCGPTDYKAFTLEVGSSLTVAGDVTNFADNLICRDTSFLSSVRPAKPKSFACNRITR